MQPRGLVPFNGIQLAWSWDYDNDFGTIVTPQSGCAYKPTALINVDPTGLCTTNNIYQTSSIANGRIKLNMLGNLQAFYLYYVPPTACPNQLYGQNTITFDDAQGFAKVGFGLGSGGTKCGLPQGTNRYIGGGINNTTTEPWSWLVSSCHGQIGAPDFWHLMAGNVNVTGPNYHFFWGDFSGSGANQGCDNLIVSAQVLKPKIGVQYNNSPANPGPCGSHPNQVVDLHGIDW